MQQANHILYITGEVDVEKYKKKFEIPKEAKQKLLNVH